MRRCRILILGAAGRDFHNFNVVYRDDPEVEVVAFTAAQIPGIAGRRYPVSLAGPLYPDGIAIEEENRVEALCRERSVDEVVFAYSDITHQHVMHLASRAMAAGASFRLLGPHATMLRSRLPVIAVSAVRTGCGKSQIARWLSCRLREHGWRVVVLRHPMPYGHLVAQRVQRFATRSDLDAAACTAEEREEYEPHIAAGTVVFAGVDYAAILAAAEREADVIVWDGGNNDFPFLHPDLHIVVADALRPGQVTTHHPGEAVARMADVFLLNKIDVATEAAVAEALANMKSVNPRAPILRAASPVRLERSESLYGHRVMVVEDAPSLTHGGLAHGAGYMAARAAGAIPVDPRPFAATQIQAIFESHPHIGPVLPAMGYDTDQLAALRSTIQNAGVDLVIAATPIDLAALLGLDIPVLRARYDYEQAGDLGLEDVLSAFLASRPRSLAD